MIDQVEHNFRAELSELYSDSEVAAIIADEAQYAMMLGLYRADNMPAL